MHITHEDLEVLGFIKTMHINQVSKWEGHGMIVQHKTKGIVMHWRGRSCSLWETDTMTSDQMRALLVAFKKI
jgi:hypothetical protein